MNNRTLAKSEIKKSTTFSPVFGKKPPGKSLYRKPANEVHDVSSSPFRHNFGDVRVESGHSFRLSSPLARIQAKLKIGQPGDRYEQEADSVANRVMNMQEPLVRVQTEDKEEIQAKPLADQITPIVQKQPEEQEYLENQFEEEEEPIQRKLLQRQSEEEEDKEEEEELIQAKERAGSNPKGTLSVERGINAIRGGGQPLPESTLSFFESRFGADFSAVRVHTDSKAAHFAKIINAKAFTFGRNVVLGSGQYSPETSSGRQLLAHELTHVVQQSQTQTVPGQALQCKGGTFGGFFSNLGRSIASIFDDELDFNAAELQQYLTILDTSNDIEDDYNSDDKARAVVRTWITGSSPYVLTPCRITLLIKEMQSGFTGDADEKYILELLERCENHHLNIIFAPGAVNVKSLNDDFHGEEWKRLQNFYQRRFVGGISALLKGTVQAYGLAVPLGKPLGSPGVSPLSSRPGDKIVDTKCGIKSPGNCHTYKQWIQEFQLLPTFESRSGDDVLGKKKAPLATAIDPKAKKYKRRPPLLHSAKPYTPADKFIDGPTEQWVRNNLPRELLRTAYQLPADCADMAIILRHVWLVAHGRTERYGDWLIGARLREQSRSKEMLNIIKGPSQVGSWNVDDIVRPYTGTDGKPIRSYKTLSRLLHEGDILVWEHQEKKHKRYKRTGGHTQTIVKINRKAGAINEIQVLQGNQPISKSLAKTYRARAIAAAREKARKEATKRGESKSKIHRAEQKAAKRARRATPSVFELRYRAGRRIELSSIIKSELGDAAGIWSFPTGKGRRDILIAAGPPANRVQPEVRRSRRRGSVDVVRGLVDWLPELQGAKNLADIQSIFEAALIESRSLIEGGQIVINNDMAAANHWRLFAIKAGEQLWHLAKESSEDASSRKTRSSKQRIRERDLFAEDLAEESHYRPMRHMSGMLKQLGAESYSESTRRLFNYINSIFIRAARGITDIDFTRKRIRSGTEVANVLVTGFDPFEFKESKDPKKSPYQVAPRAGTWNPAGAAVLQLDGQIITGANKSAAAVEGIVFPVDYRQFRAGLVESALGDVSKRLDAAITLSMDPNIDASKEPVIERYAVGVHRLNNGRLEPIPAAPGGSSNPGPAIIEAGGDLGAISREAGLPQTRRTISNENVDRSIRTSITFRFLDATAADNALRALGLTPQNAQEVVISDPNAIATITRTMKRGVQDIGITFRAGNQHFQARILRGPGGHFLSNEVSYRVLRMMAQNPRGRLSTSFHVHTQGGEVIPQAVSNKAERRQRNKIIQAGRKLVLRLVERLKLIIKAVAERVVAIRRRSRHSSGKTRGSKQR